MGAADEAHKDRPDTSPGSDYPEKGEWVSENAYIGGSDAHDVRPARSTHQRWRMTMHPLRDRYHHDTIFLLFYCFIAIKSDQESAFQCFKSIRT